MKKSIIDYIFVQYKINVIDDFDFSYYEENNNSKLFYRDNTLIDVLDVIKKNIQIKLESFLLNPLKYNIFKINNKDFDNELYNEYKDKPLYNISDLIIDIELNIIVESKCLSIAAL